MTTFFPLNQTENAAHRSHKTLLAVDVYEKLYSFINEAVQIPLSHRQETFSQNRAHRAVLIDGARGTGKSSVLINLDTYLKSKDAQLLNRVHIFKPVDPTLLEDHDDLFLNVIVAAILSDEKVRQAQTHDPDGRQQLQNQLQSLAQALESMQSQREKQGLDKIRSFIGNQQLVEEVHNFFNSIRKLLDKDLLVLTIDDVDTSLNRAFENMEVVRRYLVTPYVLPIISGDLELYQEVTWREFHGRLLKDSTYKRMDAYERAVGLAKEYQRKILPMQYRLKMPNVPDYLGNETILIGDDNTKYSLSLPMFHGWIEALVNGPVNGLENSRLIVPLPVVRALAQLIYRLKDLIPRLGNFVHENKLTLRSLRRALLVPGIDSERLDIFQNTYRTGGDNETSYRAFVTAQNLNVPASLTDITADWYAVLKEHFQFDPLAGKVFLVMLAQTYWVTMKSEKKEEWKSVFETPLFQPLSHELHYRQFDQEADLIDWKESLQGRAPQRWLNNLPSKAILSYPVPEAGKVIPNQIYAFPNSENSRKLNLLMDLVLHRNFYSSNKKALLLCTGRILEITITSLIRELTDKDVVEILNRPPFYSFSATAGTKVMELGSDETDIFTEPEIHISDPIAITELTSEIKQWRTENNIESLNISPWLVYLIFNKVINQAWIFNQPLKVGQQPKNTKEYQIALVARQTYHSIWAAFGSFEKGPIYGLPDIVANVNIGLGINFQNSDLYRQNIAPFFNEEGLVHDFGRELRPITALLGTHPLRKWIDVAGIPLSEIITVNELNDFTPSSELTGQRRRGPKAWLRDRLGLTRLLSKPEASSLQQALRKLRNREKARVVLRELENLYPNSTELQNLLTNAIDIAFPQRGD
jgi:hypothetical protein